MKRWLDPIPQERVDTPGFRHRVLCRVWGHPGWIREQDQPDLKRDDGWGPSRCVRCRKPGFTPDIGW